MAHFWLRSEIRPDEFRTPISPLGAKKLIKKGHVVSVEDCEKRVFCTLDYKKQGCQIVKKGSWVNNSKDIIVIGLKEIDLNFKLRQKHIMFAHAYKKQKDSKQILSNFKKNSGVLYDLEYLTDFNANRVAAFGYYAGFSGAYAGLVVWINYKKNCFKSKVKIPLSTTKKNIIIDAQKKLDFLISDRKVPPKIIIIGSKGRVGRGACDFLKSFDLDITEWDINETRNKKNFPEILSHDIFINCVLSSNKSIKFLNKSEIMSERKLTLISDVSCDPGSDFNTIPLYNKPSSFNDPFQYIIKGKNPLIITAIDNLPAMLPKESSLDFENQLIPFLLDFDLDNNGVWLRAEKIFYDHVKRI